MKKINLKFKLDDPFKYVYGMLVIGNIVALYFVYSFAQKYVYSTITSDRSAYSNQVSQAKDDINSQRFEDVINEIENKSRH